MIRIEHLTLPAGLSAIVRRGADGDLAIVVSDALEPGQQRAAVRVALRAARRHDWRLGLVPLPAIAFLAAIRSGVKNLGRLLRVHAMASAVAATSVIGVGAAATLVIAAAPHAHGHASTARPNPPSYQQSPTAAQPTSPGSSGGSSPPAGPAPSHVARTGPAVVVVATPSTGPRPAPTPAPSVSTSSPPTSTPPPAPSPSTSSPPANPSPTPKPSPSPSPSAGGHCIILLGVRICL